jgi:hypothetical protein
LRLGKEELVHSIVYKVGHPRYECPAECDEFIGYTHGVECFRPFWWTKDVLAGRGIFDFEDGERHLAHAVVGVVQTPR